MTKAFIISDSKRAELIAQDPKSAEIIKSLAVGKNIQKWNISSTNKWLIVTPISIDIKRYPAIFAHLKQWQIELEKRSDQGNFWWELRPCDYYSAFEQPKIIYQRFQVKPCFAYDNKRVYINDAVWMITLNDLYLLGVLNSQPFWLEIARHCTKIQNGYQLLRTYIEKAIIPNASTTDRAAISKLVQKCLDAKGVGCEVWEKEIDERVAALYGL